MVAPALRGEHEVQITPSLRGTLSIQNAQGQTQGKLRRGDPFFLVFRLHNTGDTTLIIGPSPSLGYYIDFVSSQSEPDFFSVTQITPGNPVGTLIRNSFSPASGGQYRPLLLPARTQAEWRSPWQGSVGQQYRWPVYTPATSVGISRVYARYSPNPGPLAAGFYRSMFILGVGNRRAQFSITFQVK
ncbi:MAG: hypothetical protein LH609_13885 [Rudanella sp.]|nr:hypothetical protein [Rudanella sp.]